MSTALEAASLIMIPNSYSDGLLASVKPNDGAGDFTFSRGSNTSATRINADGYIEKGYENLLLQSNTFDTTWGGLSKTSGILGYDGTNNAWEITKPAQPYTPIYQSVSATGVWTFSLYAKANTLDKISIRNQTDGTRCDFDLLNGVAEFSGSNVISKNISNIGSGWYRCQATFTGSTSQIAIYVAWNNSTAGSVYIQDAMLNQGMVAYPYVETTTAPVAAGILEDMPRIDFSGGNQSLLLEPSRTNLIPQSEYITIFSNVTPTYNTTDTLSPEGLYNSIKAEATGSNPRVRAEYTASDGVYTLSLFAKKGTSSYLRMRAYDRTNNHEATFDLNDGSFSGETTGVTAHSEDYGNGWYRCAITYTSAISDTGLNYAQAITSDGSTGNIYTYGYQAEAASYPTSYIPTYGVSQTRLVDNCRLTSAENIIGQSAGTIFSEFIPEYSSGAQLVEIAGSISDRIFTKDLPDGYFRIDIDANGVGIVNYTSLTKPLTEGAVNKFALTYSAEGYALYINGSKITSSTDPIVFGAPVDELFLNRNISQALQNNNNAKHNTLALFQTALSDEECITLTTI